MITIQVVNEPKVKLYKFSEIVSGQIFLYKSNYYLKMQDVSVYNAVRILDGNQFNFGSETLECYPYKAHISVEREE